MVDNWINHAILTTHEQKDLYIMTNMEAFVKLGRFMISHASQFVDDTQCNRWARSGQLLTEMGMPFAPKLSEFGKEQIDTVREAASVMSGKTEMPAKLQPHAIEQPRRTRRARITKAMTKDQAPKVAKTAKVAKPVKATKTSKAVAPLVKRGRGRPRKTTGARPVAA